MCDVQCLEEAGTNQVLIFVHSRKETYKTAKFLQEEAMRNDDLAKFVPSSSASREVLQVLPLAAVCRCCLRLLLPLAAVGRFAFSPYASGSRERCIYSVQELLALLFAALFSATLVQAFLADMYMCWNFV